MLLTKNGTISIVIVIPSEMLPVTKWLYCFETSGPALKNPPVVKPKTPAETPNNMRQTNGAVSVGPKAKIAINRAQPKNAIEL